MEEGLPSIDLHFTRACLPVRARLTAEKSIGKECEGNLRTPGSLLEPAE